MAAKKRRAGGAKPAVADRNGLLDYATEQIRQVAETLSAGGGSKREVAETVLAVLLVEAALAARHGGQMSSMVFAQAAVLAFDASGRHPRAIKTRKRSRKP